MAKEYFCEDFTGKDGKVRKGCGAQIKILKDAEGKTHRVTPVQIPCRGKEGELIYAYVPHFLTCETESEKAYRDEFIAKKLADQAAFLANKDQQGGGQQQGGFRNQGGQGQRSGNTGGFNRGNGGGGARYSR
jgi:hypothetical protein